MPSFSRSDASAGVTLVVRITGTGASTGRTVARAVSNCVGTADAAGMLANSIPFTLERTPPLAEIIPAPGNSLDAVESVDTTGPEYELNDPPELTPPITTSSGTAPVVVIGPPNPTSCASSATAPAPLSCSGPSSVRLCVGPNTANCVGTPGAEACEAN